MKNSNVRWVLLLCIMLLGTTLCAQSVQSEQRKVTLNMNNVTTQQLFKVIHDKTGLSFIYNVKDLGEEIIPMVKANNEDLKSLLTRIFKDRPVTFEFSENTIIVKPGKKELKISGQITDAKTGETLPGANVLVVNTQIGAIADLDGNYNITCPGSDLEIVFSYMGYESLKKKITSSGKYNIKLHPRNVEMEEFVVIGYGAARRKDLTGAISSVDDRLMGETAATDIGTIIQGQIPGLHVLTGSGAPGEEVQMQIRGVASLSGSTTPLIVVDEVPMPSSFSINDINPADVKSIDVAKGASSAAIYGSRAAAGVIMVTTKKGSRNLKPTIDYSYTYGTRQLVSDINVLNTEEFKLLLLEATRNSAIESGFSDLKDYTYYKQFTAPGYFGEVNTPWMKLLMQSANVHQHNISIRGGGRTTNYSLSYGLADEDGMLVNTSNKRHTLSLSLNTDINSWLKTGVNFRGNISKRGQMENFRIATEARPDLPCYNEDGSYYVHKYMYSGEERFETNPMIEAKERDNTTRGLGADLSTFLEANLLDGLKIRLMYSYNYNQRKERDFSPSQTFTGSGGYKGQSGQLTNREYAYQKQEVEGRISYWKRLNKHEFDFTLAGTLSDEESRNHAITFADFPDDKVQTEIYQGVTFKYQYGSDRGSLLLSGVARGNYKFNDRYLLTLSIRTDGSSRFSPENRWSYFPSAAAAWVISEEKFLRNNPFLSFLKLRASVGKVGMGYVQEYDWMTLYKSTEYLGKPAVVPGTMGNDDLRWESTVAYDLGLDFGMFKQRLTGTLGLYKKKTKDLLYNYTLSPGIGLPSTKVNFASIENKGIEFNLNAKILTKKDWYWDFSFDIAKNINKVTGLDSHYVSSPGSSSLRSTVIEEGKSLGLFYGYKTDGIFQSWDEINACEALNKDHAYQQKFSYDKVSPGDIKLVDLNGDGYVNLKANNYEDMTVLGSSLPDFTGGMSTRLTWKWFTLSVQASFSYGNMKSWEAESSQFSFNPYRPKNLLSLALNRWTPQNPTARYPKVKLNATNYGMTDFWLHDASYLKIQNISLTYRMSPKMLNKIGFLNRFELFASVNNVHTFTSYPGPNPESYDSSNRIAGAAIDYTSYPQTRTYNFGIKVSIK